MKKRIILVTEPFSEKHIEQIKNIAGEDFFVKILPEKNESKYRMELAEALKDAELVIGHPPIELLQDVSVNAPNLKLIQMTWAGTDIYTRSKLQFPKESVLLANASGAYGMIISQYVIGLILSLMLNFKGYHDQQNRKVWNRLGPIKSLEGAQVLIYGAGDIGTSIAKRLQGFNTHTVGVCRDLKKERMYFDEICTIQDAEKYLPEADVVIGCIPNNTDTAGYMNYERMSSMKDDAIIVNVGRGNFIDCIALDTLLRNNHLWGAALDVTDPEPLPENHPLWENKKCIITPHTSGVAFSHLEETENLICKIVCENIKRYIEKENIMNNVF